MKELCILSDFDGTITDKDGLYTFIETYAGGNWREIEQLWCEGKISSKECLIEEFKLVQGLSNSLIENFVKTLNIDPYFKNFIEALKSENIDFYIVSDGLDLFINKILEKHGLTGIKVISNHAEFKNGEFKISFPNDSTECINNAGTCKCEVLKKLKNEYKKTIYIGDGVSDFCVADKADILFAKSRLAEYCSKNGIKYNSFETFKNIKI